MNISVAPIHQIFSWLPLMAVTRQLWNYQKNYKILTINMWWGENTKYKYSLITIQIQNTNHKMPKSCKMVTRINLQWCRRIQDRALLGYGAQLGILPMQSNAIHKIHAIACWDSMKICEKSHFKTTFAGNSFIKT